MWGSLRSHASVGLAQARPNYFLSNSRPKSKSRFTSDQRKMKGNSTPASVIVNCTNFSSEYFLELATVRGTTDGLCMLLAVLILVIVVFVRAFESLLQRLFVYLTAITVCYMTVQIMQLKPVYTGLSSDQLQFCAAMGFLGQWATVCIHSFTLVVSLVILCKVCDWDICSFNSQTGWTKKFIEGAFVLFLIILPLPFIWVPFLDGNYASIREPWCWIVSHNKDCSMNIAGFWEEIGLNYIPLGIVGLFTVLFVLLTVGVFCKRACTYELTRRSHEKKAVETVLLLVFLLLFVTFAGIEAASNLFYGFTKKRQSYALSVVHAVITPVSKFMIPVGYFFYLYSLKKFQWGTMKVATRKWKKLFICHRKKSKSSEQQTGPGPGGGETISQVTVRSSYAIVGRSDTHFTVPYTGGFTDIGSTTALLTDEHPDTGYGSLWSHVHPREDGRSSEDRPH